MRELHRRSVCWLVIGSNEEAGVDESKVGSNVELKPNLAGVSTKTVVVGLLGRVSEKVSNGNAASWSSSSREL